MKQYKVEVERIGTTGYMVRGFLTNPVGAWVEQEAEVYTSHGSMGNGFNIMLNRMELAASRAHL